MTDTWANESNSSANTLFLNCQVLVEVIATETFLGNADARPGDARFVLRSYHIN